MIHMSSDFVLFKTFSIAPCVNLERLETLFVIDAWAFGGVVTPMDHEDISRFMRTVTATRTLREVVLELRFLFCGWRWEELEPQFASLNAILATFARLESATLIVSGSSGTAEDIDIEHTLRSVFSGVRDILHFEFQPTT